MVLSDTALLLSFSVPVVVVGICPFAAATVLATAFVAAVLAVIGFLCALFILFAAAATVAPKRRTTALSTALLNGVQRSIEDNRKELITDRVDHRQKTSTRGTTQSLLHQHLTVPSAVCIPGSTANQLRKNDEGFLI